jgi:signal transduction histidine kinase
MKRATISRHPDQKSLTLRSHVRRLSSFIDEDSRLWILIAGPILAILVIVAGCSYALLADVAKTQDENYAQTSSQLVERSLKARSTELEKLADENAEWDTGFKYTSISWDEDGLSKSYYTDFSEVVGVVGQDGDVGYLSIADRSKVASLPIEQLIDSGRLSTMARSHIAKIKDYPKATSTLVNFDGRLVIIASSIIRPLVNSKLKVQQGQKRFFYVSATFLTQEWLAATATLTGIDELSFVSGTQAPLQDRPSVVLPVHGPDNATIGWMVWPHKMPGSAAFANRKLTIGLGLCLIGLFAILVSAHLIRAQMLVHRKARALAEDASRMKSEFLANMSHELRTPLNAVIGYAEIIAEDCEITGAKETVKDAGRISRSANHLLSLINSVLDHAKLEAGKIEITPEDVALKGLLEEVVEVIAKTAQDNGNEVVLTHDPDLGNAQIDRLRLKQCLLNLASNGVKFTKNGKITIAARPVSLAEGPCIRVTVSDTGIGMSPEVLSRLFRPFEQANGSTTRTYGGTGLGLSISRQLIEAMGGRIEVSSDVGVGSAFTLIFPRGDSVALTQDTLDPATLAHAA